MITSKWFFRRLSNVYVLAFLLFGLIGFLVAQVQQERWAGGTRLFCVFYAGVISVFFLAQLVAFVVGHANYSEAVEQPKFDMIFNEEKEWEGLKGRGI